MKAVATKVAADQFIMTPILLATFYTCEYKYYTYFIFRMYQTLNWGIKVLESTNRTTHPVWNNRITPQGLGEQHIYRSTLQSPIHPPSVVIMANPPYSMGRLRRRLPANDPQFVFFFSIRSFRRKGRRIWRAKREILEDVCSQSSFLDPWTDNQLLLYSSSPQSGLRGINLFDLDQRSLLYKTTEKRESRIRKFVIYS